jgi:hypothetical protein
VFEVSGQSDKFADLEAQTDRNRVQFLQRDLELCFTLASLAETEHDLGHREAANRSVAHAEEGYASIQRFLSDPKHTDHIGGEIGGELMAGLKRLRVTLDGIRTSIAEQ